MSLLVQLTVFIVIGCIIKASAKCSYECTMEDESLDCWRGNIDVFSNQILDAVNQRLIVASHIGEWKRKRGLPIYDPTRANLVLDNIVKRNKGPMPDESIRAIFDVIVNKTTIYEENVKGKPPNYVCPDTVASSSVQQANTGLLIGVLVIETFILVVFCAVLLYLLVCVKPQKYMAASP